MVALTVGPVHIRMRASKERASEGSVLLPNPLYLENKHPQYKSKTQSVSMSDLLVVSQTFGFRMPESTGEGHSDPAQWSRRNQRRPGCGDNSKTATLFRRRSVPVRATGRGKVVAVAVAVVIVIVATVVPGAETQQQNMHGLMFCLMLEFIDITKFPTHSIQTPLLQHLALQC